ncbi:MAG: limonene-1,2-epoxide hydrolase family protein, partial [Rhodococcus sp. (in: high G+C Gram-positive bacteria)]
EFWVCGTFELRDGKVAVWRDYFDNVDFLKGLVRGTFLPRSPLRSSAHKGHRPVTARNVPRTRPFRKSTLSK